MHTHTILFAPSKEIPSFPAQYGGWSALVYWGEESESWGGEAPNSSCHSHLLNGTVNPRWHSCQSKQSRHILHKGVVTRWTSTNCRRLFRVDTWQRTCILASCPPLYRCTLRSMSSLRKCLFVSNKTYCIWWYYLCLCESPFVLQRHVSQVNFETLNCTEVFCFRPAEDWRPVQGVSLLIHEICAWHGVPLKILLSSAAQQRLAGTC